MAVAKAAVKARVNQDVKPTKAIEEYSQEVIIALVGYAGAGCTSVAKQIIARLETFYKYEVHLIKMSELIEAAFEGGISIPEELGNAQDGKRKLYRAKQLQNLGDELRQKYGNTAIAQLCVREIKSLRDLREVGENKIAFIIDSVKHEDEVAFLRSLYERSFRLVAVHCDKETREERLVGDLGDQSKFNGACEKEILEYMARDERDKKLQYGQRVRDAFYIADFFLDNSQNEPALSREHVFRFCNIIMGTEIIRPTRAETGMYAAYCAAMRSSCLSRQVGAALESSAGNFVSLGTNEVPKYGGGTYEQDKLPDNRCHAWEWGEGKATFKGCHNTRVKRELKEKIANWIKLDFFGELVEFINKENPTKSDISIQTKGYVDEYISKNEEMFLDMPEVNDIIEYSRSIHAEMDALLSAARSGTSTVNSTLYCTTFPCHNCARHLVSAGVDRVYYIEPYVKSKALELHFDSISTDPKAASELDQAKAVGQRSDATVDQKLRQTRMFVIPFTGVGPRMYADYFEKRESLKDDQTGEVKSPNGSSPVRAARLRALEAIETEVVKEAPERGQVSRSAAANDARNE